MMGVWVTAEGESGHQHRELAKLLSFVFFFLAQAVSYLKFNKLPGSLIGTYQTVLTVQG